MAGRFHLGDDAAFNFCKERWPVILIWERHGDADSRHKLVTEYLPDTPCVARAYYPGCEPDADPCQEILEVRWCESHSPVRDAADDEVVTASAYLSGKRRGGRRRQPALVRHPARPPVASR